MRFGAKSERPGVSRKIFTVIRSNSVNILSESTGVSQNQVDSAQDQAFSYPQGVVKWLPGRPSLKFFTGGCGFAVKDLKESPPGLLRSLRPAQFARHAGNHAQGVSDSGGGLVTLNRGKRANIVGLAGLRLDGDAPLRRLLGVILQL